jgi:hypothetical protein
VALPWKLEFLLEQLLDNRKSAMKRLSILSQRLNRDESLKKRYNSVFEEYEKLGFIQEVNEHELEG